MAFHEGSYLSGRSVGGFQDLPRQCGRILTSKERNRCNILLVELDGSTQGKRGRLCCMLLALHISQAFLSVWNRKTTGLQA